MMLLVYVTGASERIDVWQTRLLEKWMECNGWVSSCYLPCRYNDLTISQKQPKDIWNTQGIQVTEDIASPQVIFYVFA